MFYAVFVGTFIDDPIVSMLIKLFMRSAMLGVDATVLVSSDVRILLRRYGVFTWGFFEEDKVLYFCIRKEKARWAYKVLSMHNFPVVVAPEWVTMPSFPGKSRRGPIPHLMRDRRDGRGKKKAWRL